MFISLIPHSVICCRFIGVHNTTIGSIVYGFKLVGTPQILLSFLQITLSMHIRRILVCSILILIPVFSIWIYSINRIISTIRIRTNVIVFLRQWIHGRPTTNDGVIHAGTVVIPVKTVHTVKLLTVVFVRLHTVAHVFPEQSAKRIVVVHLLNRAVGIQHHTVVAQMILQVIVINRRSTVESNVTTIYQYRFQVTVFVYHVSTIIRFQSHRHIRCLRWYDTSHRHHQVGLRGGICHTQLLSLRIIPVFSQMSFTKLKFRQ